MLTMLWASWMLLGFASASPVDILKRPGFHTTVELDGCVDYQSLMIPEHGLKKIDFLGSGAYGCTYAFELVIDHEVVNAVAKTFRNKRMNKIEVEGLKMVGQYIADFIDPNTKMPWIIMHRQPGLPLGMTRGWQMYVGSEYPQPRKSQYPRHLCVAFLKKAYTAVATEVVRIASLPTKVHNIDLHLGNVLFEETWRREGLNPENLIITAKIVDWDQYEVTDRNPINLADNDLWWLSSIGPITALKGSDTKAFCDP